MNIRKLLFPVVLCISSLVILNSCKVSIPKGATAVKNFDVNQYLGKWYEIARFDFRFEKNLNNTTAEYSKNEDGSIKVKNRGFNYVKKEWKESIGKAKFVDDSTEARLKVSFFQPIWSGYNVIDLVDYKYALIAGNDLDYLWVLSRDTHLPEDVKQRFLKKAKSIGYDTNRLIWVEHK